MDFFKEHTGSRFQDLDGYSDVGFQFGDWLGLDNETGSYSGATEHAFLAGAFTIYSSEILSKVAGIIGKDDDRIKISYPF